MLVPVPVIPPGLMVHPSAGNRLNETLPVAVEQFGWTIVPTLGATGVTGCVLITTLAEGTEVHPAELVTVKL